MQVHEAIIAQLGGAKIFAMAFKREVHSEKDKSVTFALAPGLQQHKPVGKKTTHVRITLDPTDTYTVEFLSVPRKAASPVKTLESVSFVFGTELKGLVERTTGLALSL